MLHFGDSAHCLSISRQMTLISHHQSPPKKVTEVSLNQHAARQSSGRYLLEPKHVHEPDWPCGHHDTEENCLDRPMNFSHYVHHFKFKWLTVRVESWWHPSLTMSQCYIQDDSRVNATPTFWFLTPSPELLTPADLQWTHSWIHVYIFGFKIHALTRKLRKLFSVICTLPVKLEREKSTKTIILLRSGVY